jgi:glycogen debranching enzyme
VVTSRIGKPVEVQALWINALVIGARLCPARAEIYRAHAAQGQSAFPVRFWNPAQACLHDVIDVDHVPGVVDSSVRPNQIFAIGGLPLSLLADDQARVVVETVERRLFTPLGLRTLAPEDPAYVGRYAGDPETRDRAYHQGAVWPWLLGPFVEAWVRVRANSLQARREARERFVPPLLAHLATAGVGPVSEIADGDLPHQPGGCPFQAWSLGELLRLRETVLRIS